MQQLQEEAAAGLARKREQDPDYDYNPYGFCEDMRSVVQREGKHLKFPQHCKICHDNFPHQDLPRHFRSLHPNSEEAGLACRGAANGCKACLEWLPRATKKETEEVCPHCHEWKDSNHYDRHLQDCIWWHCRNCKDPRKLTTKKKHRAKHERDFVRCEEECNICQYKSTDRGPRLKKDPTIKVAKPTKHSKETIGNSTNPIGEAQSSLGIEDSSLGQAQVPMVRAQSLDKESSQNLSASSKKLSGSK